MYSDEEDDQELDRDLSTAERINESMRFSTDPIQMFKEEQFIAKSKLMFSDYKDIILKMIAESTLTESCKESLSYCIFYGFDKSAVLAKTKDIDIKRLKFEIALNTAKLGYKKTDVRNPQLPIIEETIRQAFDDYSSRSEGGWERTLQNSQQIISDTTIRRDTPKTSPIEQRQKKRGFNFSFLGGGE
jgi:hypothetical protein